jgi:hypothetical protein
MIIDINHTKSATPNQKVTNVAHAFYNCNIRANAQGGKIPGKIFIGTLQHYVLLFSTSTTLPALYLVKYYEAPFHIEFVFRDAKQHLGLSDCQSTQEGRLDAHFNF